MAPKLPTGAAPYPKARAASKGLAGAGLRGLGVWFACASLALAWGCEEEPLAGPQNALQPAPQPDLPWDAPLDAEEDARPDAEEDVQADVERDIAPDLPPDEPPDAPPDGPQGFDADGFGEDFIRPEPDASPDDAGVDGEEDPTTRVEGTRLCLDYRLETTGTTFTLKEDQIAVLFQVNNVCSEPYHIRLEHMGDMFPVGIQKDGEPWIFLPDCPGTGEPFTYTLRPGDGWSRGWIWSPQDHLERLERCGVVFEEDAEYSIVGYGVRDVPQTDPEAVSETFPLTEPIPIFLYVSDEEGE